MPGSRKGKTGLEWLLREANAPAMDVDSKPGAEHVAPEPPPEEQRAAPEPWRVATLSDIAKGPRANAEPDGGTPPVAPARSKAKTKETRQHPRVLARFPVHYKKGSEPLEVEARNLCVGGLFMATVKYLPVGDIFQAQLVFPDHAKRTLAIIAEVIWATAGDPDDLEKSPPGMGIKFLDVDDKDLPFLKEIVSQFPPDDRES